MPTYANKSEIAERNERAHQYSVKCCRRRSRQMRRRNERRERIQRGLAITAIVLAAVVCGVLLGGVV